MNADPALPPIPRRRAKTQSRWVDLIPVIIVLAIVGAIAVSAKPPPLLRLPEETAQPNQRGGRSSKPPPLLRLPEETAQPNQSAPSNLRDKVLSALEPEIRSHPDVIKSFHNRAKHLKGKIILIANESLLFTEDTFWEFADALLVKKDKDLATQKATQWVKTGGAILTVSTNTAKGLVKSVDGPFYRFICVESTLNGSKTNFWLSINDVSRRSPTDFALAINQYQKPFGSDAARIVSARVGDAFWCVYHFSDGGLNGDEISTSGYDVGITPENVDQEDKDKSPSESSPAESTDSADEMIQKGEQRAQEYFEAQQAERKYEESIRGFRVTYNQEFKLGDYTYKITRVQTVKTVGPESHRQNASEGAWFVVVNFLIRNDGKQTAETDANDFRLRDGEGREFSPDSAATTTVSSDFILRELHPGIFKKAITVFEVPDSVARAKFKILIPEKGLTTLNTKSAIVPLAPARKFSRPTAAPKRNTKRPNRSGRVGKTGAGEKIYPSEPLSEAKPEADLSSDWGMAQVMRNGRYELVPVYYGVYRRKEQIGLEQEQRGEDNITPEQRELERRMSRPPGVPWRNFSAPDEHGYPNN